MKRRVMVGLPLLGLAVVSLILSGYYPDALSPAVGFLRQNDCTSCDIGTIGGFAILLGIAGAILLLSGLGSLTMRRSGKSDAEYYQELRARGVHCVRCRDTRKCWFCNGERIINDRAAGKIKRCDFCAGSGKCNACRA